MPVATGRFVSRISRVWRSFGFKFALLLVIFLAVPVLLFIPLSNADLKRNELLILNVRDKGRLIAEGIRPVLGAAAIKAPQALSDSLHRFSQGGLGIKILFRPAIERGPSNFFFVAAAPSVSIEYLEEERINLARIGVFERLDETCQTDDQSALSYKNPSGEIEILTSITPIKDTSGCWLVVTTHRSADFPVAALGTPIWATPQLIAALAIYGLMAAVIASLFGGLWLSLRRFGALAREIHSGRNARASFAERNSIPELESVAAEFDRLVTSMRESADSIRRAAEENAHALKAPLAVIAQSIEPIRKSTLGGEPRARRAVELIERSVERLDAIVSAARQMDEASAELIDPPRDRINLSRLVDRMATFYDQTLAGRNIAVKKQIEPGLMVRGGEDLLETILENLLDNAASFSPEGGAIKVSLARDRRLVVLTIEDNGPGVAETELTRIFNRYVSLRSRTATDENSSGGSHFGIGLWIVRRNIEAMGGTIRADNHFGGGLMMTASFPAE